MKHGISQQSNERLEKTMLALSDTQKHWVQSTLDRMSIEACAGQLLCPLWHQNTTENWLCLLDEMPHIPNLMLTFGTSSAQQQAAVRIWLGEIVPQGDLPIQLPTISIKPLT